MTRNGPGKLALLARWSPIPIVAGGFFLTLIWARPRPIVAEILTALAVIFVLGYTQFLGKWQSQEWDEVQRAGWGFASANSGWGYFAAMVLLTIPPVMNGLIDLVNGIVARAGHNHLPPDTANRVAVTLAFWFGITLVIVMQGLAHVIATIIWWRRMGRAGDAQ